MRKRIRNILILLLLLLFLWAGWMLARYGVARWRDRAAFDELVRMVETGNLPTAAPTENAPAVTDAPIEANVPTETVAPAASDEAERRLERYAQVWALNEDFFGWLQIEGTIVNYPVMFTPENPQYYLYRGFDREESRSGTLFLDESCFVGCGNYLIHGHHMKDGSMFGALDAYAEEDYWREHPVIRFDTLDAVGEYEVLAACYARVYDDGDTPGFRYYEYTDLTDEARFEEFMREICAIRLYDTGVEAEFGDELITLSTCEYHREDGRFIVVARRRKE